ncbi:MAG UNVERIFIED_CONTAM: chorismate-binding protein [Planctomycetaceae bacterium]
MQSNFTEDSFCHAVERCREYIRAGDVFQVVISQRLSCQSPAKPLDVYRASQNGQSQPIHVPAANPRHSSGRQFPGNHGSSRSGTDHHSTARRDPPTRQNARRRQSPRSRTPRRSQRTCRTRDAH